MRPLLHRPLGRLDHGAAHSLQAEAREALLADPDGPDVLFTVEHPPVLTAGKRARDEHLLAEPAALDAAGVQVRYIERGGDWTWHGPGQLVAYPIVHLRRRRLAVKDFVAVLEGAMAAFAGRVLADAGVAHAGLGTVCGAPGAWITRPDGTRAKLGAVGLHVRHGVTLHGLALNLDPEPWGFDWIVPCGLADASTTSLAREIARSGGRVDALPSVEEAGERLAAALASALADPHSAGCTTS